MNNIQHQGVPSNDLSQGQIDKTLADHGVKVTTDNENKKGVIHIDGRQFSVNIVNGSGEHFLDANVLTQVASRVAYMLVTNNLLGKTFETATIDQKGIHSNNNALISHEKGETTHVYQDLNSLIGKAKDQSSLLKETATSPSSSQPMENTDKSLPKPPAPSKPSSTLSTVEKKYADSIGMSYEELAEKIKFNTGYGKGPLNSQTSTQLPPDSQPMENKVKKELPPPPDINAMAKALPPIPQQIKPSEQNTVKTPLSTQPSPDSQKPKPFDSNKPLPTSQTMENKVKKQLPPNPQSSSSLSKVEKDYADSEQMSYEELAEKIKFNTGYGKGPFNSQTSTQLSPDSQPMENKVKKPLSPPPDINAMAKALPPIPQQIKPPEQNTVETPPSENLSKSSQEPRSSDTTHLPSDLSQAEKDYVLTSGIKFEDPTNQIKTKTNDETNRKSKLSAIKGSFVGKRFFDRLSGKSQKAEVTSLPTSISRPKLKSISDKELQIKLGMFEMELTNYAKTIVSLNQVKTDLETKEDLKTGPKHDAVLKTVEIRTKELSKILMNINSLHSEISGYDLNKNKKLQELIGKTQQFFIHLTQAKDVDKAAIEHIEKNKSKGEIHQGIITAYTDAWSEKYAFRNPDPPGRLISGHQVLMNRDPDNKENYQTLIDIFNETHEALTQASTSLKPLFERADGLVGASYKIKTDLNETEKTNAAIARDQLNDKIKELKKQVEQVRFLPNEKNQISNTMTFGDLSLMTLTGALEQFQKDLKVFDDL